MWKDRLRVAETYGMAPSLVGRTMAVWFTEGYRVAHHKEVERIAAMLRHTDPRG
jgi:hypothetical protein